jgi:hypothetical protein
MQEMAYGRGGQYVRQHPEAVRHQRGQLQSVEPAGGGNLFNSLAGILCLRGCVSLA